MPDPLDVLLVAPYYGGSHRAWADGYARHSRHAVRLVTMPARFWKWRMHGGAVTLTARLREQGEDTPDIVLATDMVNVPALLALARRELAQVPVVLYCHENQLTYPLQDGERLDFAFPMINWLSMLTADCVLFNSEFHRDDWFGALPSFLKAFPDFTHTRLMPAVVKKSRVLPVGITLEPLDAARPQAEASVDAPPLVLWNQRWEYDKDPATFFRALRELVARGLHFRVALAGANVRQAPEEFEAAREWLGNRIVHYGRADRATYQRLLWEADIVVSTAYHEFFGIAVVEAIYCQTFPLLPNRLAYPELLPEAFHAPCLYRDFDGLVEGLCRALTEPGRVRTISQALRPSMARFAWTAIAPHYDRLLAEISGIPALT